MKHEDILAAAFRAWGREAYRKMSLTQVAAELGVTKPALYRHFKDKDQLLAAMHTSFFDRYAKAMRASFPEGLVGATGSVSLTLRLVEALARFFGSNPADLAFMFARILRFSDVEKVFATELANRGMQTDRKTDEADPGRNRSQMAVATCFFMVAFFHLNRRDKLLSTQPSQEELSELLVSIRELTSFGLVHKPDPEAAQGITLPAIDYTALDAKARLSELETAAPDGLLPAVAAVVAEVGSWNASMDMVAKRSGLSKSGLYSHFKSKEEMLVRLFSVEFERISTALEKRQETDSPPAERLYLAMATASEYLLARPDILVALNWLRMQRLGVPDLLPARLLELFSFLGDEDSGLHLVAGSLGMTIRWILFLTVHHLIGCAGTLKSNHAERLQELHKFMLGGLTGGVKP